MEHSTSNSKLSAEASSRAKGLFASEDQLFVAVKQYMSNFQYQMFKELYNLRSPWFLLSIFLGDSFVGDFTIGTPPSTSIIPNNEICWHLYAIGKALEAGSADLAPYYGPKFIQPFYYSGNAQCVNGQAKLFYSLLYFCMTAHGKGYTEIVEAGGGEGKGGANHRAVCNVLSAMDIQMRMTLIDPLHETSEEQIGKCTLLHKNGYVLAQDTYDVPVFCDMYDELNWHKIQEEIKSPLKMLKALNYAFGDEILLQPGHYECRIMPNKQLAHVCQSYSQEYREFDTCTMCLLWRALMHEFGISSEHIVKELIHLAVKPCKRVAGAGTFIKMQTPKSEKLFNLRHHVYEIETRPGRPTVSPSRAPSRIEAMILGVIRRNNLTVFEPYVRGRTNLSQLAPELFAGDGIPLFYSVEDIRVSDQAGVVIIKGTEIQTVYDRLGDLGCEIIDEDSTEGTYCIRFVKKNNAKSDSVYMAPPMLIDPSWVLPGEFLNFRCFRHRFTNQMCKGLWCPDKCGFAIWRRQGKYAFVRYSMRPTMMIEEVKQYFFNYAIAGLSAQDLTRRLTQLYRDELLRQIEEIYPYKLSDFQLSCIDELVVAGARPTCARGRVLVCDIFDTEFHCDVKNFTVLSRGSRCKKDSALKYVIQLTSDDVGKLRRYVAKFRQEIDKLI